ncbi:protein lifeguard 3-like isoform X2 [Tigriopus californicus]|uniref:protein lifeguard 3-like isoform X2 n=1 Tax=Tigriopus californicus TaxID=6832 RepID=UPI0027DA1BB4|nr:protein lifeguard 3-like isoform X2 [Tigriopus californicus]
MNPGYQQQPPPYPTNDGGGYMPQPGYPPPGGYPPQGGFPPQASGYQQPQSQGPSGFGGMMGAHAGMSNMMRNVTGGYDSDAEGGNAGNMASFADKAVRRGFIRKVYGILSIQLMITCAIIAIFVFVDSLRIFAIQNRSLYWVAFGLTMVCMIAMACCESVRRKAPTNFIFLGIFTICEGFMMGTLAAHFQADAVLIAAGICAVVTLALTIFAFQTKYDFTTCGGMLCGLTVILMLAGILMIFMPHNKWAMIGYGSAGALIFSMYIVYDTQLMMGGSHKYSIDPEEYIFAALNLYLDIINLFMYILMIIGGSRSD